MDTELLKNPSIELWGLQIDEPVTVITDLLVGAVCFYAYFRLRQKKRDHLVYRYNLLFFLLMGIATVFGGIFGHAFSYALSSYWKIPGWFTSMIAIALAERGAIIYALPLIQKQYATFWTWLNLAELSFFMIISVITMNFYFVVGHSAYGVMVVIGGFHTYVFFRTRQRASIHYWFAVFWSAVGGLIFINRLAISVWFNHLDIAHVFMALSAWHIYRGVLGIIDDPGYEKKW